MKIKNNDRQHCFIGEHYASSDFEYSEQYKTAFKLLLNSNVENNKISMPMLFLLRHYFELILKYNIDYFKDFSDIDYLVSKLHYTHDLLKLKEAFYQHWDEIKKQYPGLLYKKDITSEKKFRQKLDSIIDILTQIDNGDASTRFSKKKDGTYAVKNQVIDIIKLNKSTDSVIAYLNNTIHLFEHSKLVLQEE